jgi:hypothetical protein
MSWWRRQAGYHSRGSTAAKQQAMYSVRNLMLEGPLE